MGASAVRNWRKTHIAVNHGAMADTQYLFVYGTRSKAGGHPIHERVAKRSRFVGEASMQGKLFRMETSPGVVDSDDPADSVRGELYEVIDPKPLFEELDAYEGCGPMDVPPTLYVRAKRPIRLSDGRALEAWVYLYNRPTEGLKRIASGRFRRQ